jgi:hypothetical protein
MRASLTELAALMTERASADVTAAALAVPAARLTWKPSDAARSTVMSQVFECAVVNTLWAAVVANRGIGKDIMPPAYLKLRDAQAAGSLDTWVPMLAALEQSTLALASAIRALPEDETGTVVPVWEGTMPLSECCFYAYWHLAYHEGQINYLQTLYGDQGNYHAYHMNADAEPRAAG